ncbi:MAG: peptidylprolyl isomerase [Maricaulaceae bacterium]
MATLYPSLRAAAIALLAGAFTPALSAQQLTPTEDSDAEYIEGIVALVNDEVVSTYDVRQRMLLILNTTGVRPTDEVLPQVQSQAVRTLVDERLQLQEAAKFEIEVTDEEVKGALQNISGGQISIEQMAEQFARGGVGMETLENQVRADVAWRILVNGRFGSSVRISDNQVEQQMARMEDSLTKPRYLISEIYLETPLGVDEATIRQTANTILELLRQGRPFPQVARSFSKSATARTGGDRGWVSTDDLRPELARAVEQLDVGQVSVPIRSAGGYYLIALRNKTEAAENVVVSLKQLILPFSPGESSDETENRLSAAVQNARGCETVETVRDAEPGILINELPSVRIADLASPFRETAAVMAPGQMSPTMTTQAGPAVLMICERSFENVATVLPKPDDIEDELVSRQLNLLSQRWLRDLRRDSTVDIRL